MSIRHTLIKGVALSTLLLLIAGPAGAATSDTTTRGTAATTSVPLSVEALNQPAAELGRTVLMATTDSDRTTLAPWSTVQLTLANIGGAKFGEVGVTSDGTMSSTGASVDRDTAIGAVGATTSSVLAHADDAAGSAAAALTTLTTDATVLNALDLEATISGVTTTVNDDAAAATHSLAVAAIDLELAHVLGSVLNELPLEDLTALAEELGVDAPVNLDPVNDVVNATVELAGAIAAAVTAADAVETALIELDTADGGTLIALQELIAAVQSLTVADLLTDSSGLQTILDDDAFPIDCDVNLGLVTIDQDLLDSIVTCLEGEVAGHLTTLEDEISTLETALTNYVDAVAAAAAAATNADLAADGLTVSDIIADIEALLAGLLDADLLDVGPIEVSQQVRAVGRQLDDSSASNTCEVTTIAALGADPVEIADCDGGSDTLTTVIDTVTGTLQTILDTVGGIDTGDGVSLELFGTNTTSVTEKADGWVRATSVMEVLTLTIPDITIDECEVAQGLLCGLDIDVEGTLATLLGIADNALTTAQATVDSALTDANALLAALEAEGLIDVATLTDPVNDLDAGAVQEAVNDVVDQLSSALNDLIDGLSLGTGGGTKIPGAEIVVDPSLEAEHQVVAAGGPTDPAPNPDDDPTLPNTGGGAALLAVVAIGAGAWLWRRREAH